VDDTPKQRVVETLRLLASRDEQMEYRRRVPIADVSAELFCFWDDVFWQDDTALRGEVTEMEWNALLRFHSVFERVVRLMPHDRLPPIERFVDSPHWLQLSRAAARALQVLDPPQKVA
jgi:hypothetical protein